MKFTSLTKALEGFFDQPLASLPKEQRRRVETDFPMPWDDLSPDQRREVARQWDLQNDPGLEEERQELWDTFVVGKTKLVEEIDEWERTRALTITEIDMKKTKLDQLRGSLADLEASERQLLDGQGASNDNSCPPLSAAQIRQYFPVIKGDHDENAKWWRRKMQAARDNGLHKCRVGSGRKGHAGSMWKPDEVAHWLLDRHEKWGKKKRVTAKGYEGMEKNALHAALKKIPGCDMIADEWYPPDEAPSDAGAS